MDTIFGRVRPGGDARSRAIVEDADRTVTEERRRLARLRPVISRLMTQDWDGLYRDRISDGK